MKYVNVEVRDKDGYILWLQKVDKGSFIPFCKYPPFVYEMLRLIEMLLGIEREEEE